MDFACNNHTAVYKNNSSSTMTLTDTVTERCGGNSRLYTADASGNIVKSAFFESPGGTATFDMDPDQELLVFCDGASDHQGCSVDIVFK